MIIFTFCGSPDTSNPKTKSALLPYHIDLEKDFKNLKSVPASSIGKNIKYIPLETTTESILGSINDIGTGRAKIVFSSFFIFISDGNRLLQFDRSGKFIKQIGTQGRGPGQYTQVADFCIDEKKNNIYIIGGRFVLTFDFNGQFKESSDYEWRSLRFMQVDSSKFIFYLGSSPVKSNDTVYSWYITDLRCKPRTKLINFHKRFNMPGMSIGRTPLYSFDERAHFMEYCADTLFYIRSNKPEPYATINLGNLRMDPDPILTSNQIDDRLNQKLWPLFINESDKFIFMMLHWGFSDSSGFCVYNKGTKETTFLKHKAFVNNLDGGPSFWPKYIYNDNTLVDFIYADKLLGHIKKKNASKQSISNELKALGQLITETSNPILMVLQ